MRIFPKSVALAALAIFISINLSFQQCYSWGKQICLHPRFVQRLGLAGKFISHSGGQDEACIEYTVSEFKKLPSRPNVVLLGSSLMMFPFWAVDRDQDRSLRRNALLYHHARFLEARLRQMGLREASVYNLSTPLQMVSDSYYYVDKLLHGAKAPDMVILGVSPRDFWDTEFDSPGNTLNFADQASLLDAWRYSSLYFRGWEERVGFAIERTLFFYDKRAYIQGFLNDRLNFGSTPLMANGSQLAYGLNKYERRYKGIDSADLSRQVQFLDNLCRLCRQRQIALLVVNMPLPGPNKDLMTPQFYSRFGSTLQMVLSANGVPLLDLSNHPDFTSDREYMDAAHMNKLGGYKLIEHLVEHAGILWASRSPELSSRSEKAQT